MTKKEKGDLWRWGTSSRRRISTQLFILQKMKDNSLGVRSYVVNERVEGRTRKIFFREKSRKIEGWGGGKGNIISTEKGSGNYVISDCNDGENKGSRLEGKELRGSDRDSCRRFWGFEKTKRVGTSEGERGNTT